MTTRAPRSARILRSVGSLLVLALLGACQPSSDAPLPGERIDRSVTERDPEGFGYDALDASVASSSLPEQFASLWEPWRGDLDGMRERRAIRVLVVHSGYLYFFDKGQPRGITADMLAEFEGFLNRKLGTGRLPVYVVPIPVTRERLLPDLLAGRADLVAANLTVTPVRRKQMAFSAPVHAGVSEVIVAGPAAPALDSLDDLAGKDIFVRQSSSYHESLLRLSEDFRQRQLPPPRIRLVEEVLEDEDILEMVNAGIYPLTVVDDVKARYWAGLLARLELREDLALNRDGKIAWAMRPDNPQLKALVDEFMGGHGQGTLFGNVVRDKYLDDQGWVESVTSSAALDRFGQLVELFTRYGEQYGFDWLELAAQAFQESGLDHNRRSPAGAVGIMQIKPSTAADPQVGIEDVHDLENNIHAGARYLRFLADRYFDDASVHPLDQWLLAVAAYNAGPAKIAKMRRLAKKHGYDPTVWFDNVEVIVARNVGRETVSYVSNIYKYYVAYKLSWERREQRDRVIGDSLESGR